MRERESIEVMNFSVVCTTFEQANGTESLYACTVCRISTFLFAAAVAAASADALHVSTFRSNRLCVYTLHRVPSQVTEIVGICVCM